MQKYQDYLHRILSSNELLDIINPGHPEASLGHKCVVLGIFQEQLCWKNINYNLKWPVNVLGSRLEISTSPTYVEGTLNFNEDKYRIRKSRPKMDHGEEK